MRASLPRISRFRQVAQAWKKLEYRAVLFEAL